MPLLHADKPYVVVTRPPPGLEETCRRVVTQGWRAIAHPMLKISSLGVIPRVPTDIFDAIIVSSAQVLHALAEIPKKTPIYAVGAATAARLKDAGFLHVHVSGGTSAAIVSDFRNMPTPKRLFFPTGEGLGLELTQQLQSLGHDVSRVETYKSEKIQTFSTDLLEQIQLGAVASVLFYSARTADAWTSTAQAQLFPTVSLRAIALSEGVAQHLRRADWLRIDVSDTPDQAGLLKLLGSPNNDEG